MSDKGTCSHGEFDLVKGCPECIKEYSEVNSPENIAKRIKESEENLPPNGLAEAARAAGAKVTRTTIKCKLALEEEAEGLKEAITKAKEVAEGNISAVDGLLKAVALPSCIVKVVYISLTTGEISDKEYTYYSVDRLAVGDIVAVPVRGTTTKAKVSAIDIPEAEIATYKDKVKTIPTGLRLGKADRGDVVVAEATVLEDGVLDTKINLCDTCTLRNDYPVCSPRDVVFGDGKGNDNIIKCCKYEYGPAAACTIPLNVESGPKAEEPAAEGEVYQGEPKGSNILTQAGLKLIEKELPEMAVALAAEKTTAIIKVGPETDLAYHQLQNEVERLQKFAETVVVTNVEESKQVTNDLALMSRLTKAVEVLRKEYVSPLNDYVKHFNDAFRKLSEPLKNAKNAYDTALLSYQHQMAKERAKAEEDQRIAKAEALRQAMEIKKDTGEIVDVVPEKVDLPPEAATKVRTDLGTVSQVENWKWVIVDLALIPTEYWKVDEVLLGKVIRAGVRDIPGLKIYNDPILRTRA